MVDLASDVWIDREAVTEAIDQAEGLMQAGRWQDAWAPGNIAAISARLPFLPGEDPMDRHARRLRVNLTDGRAAIEASLRTVEDLLRYYPRRYAVRGELTDLSTVKEGEHVTVMAEIVAVTVRPMRQRRGSILEAVISDGRQPIAA